MEMTNEIQKHIHAARHECVFFDHPNRGVIEARGKDRTSFLHNVLSNDIKSLTPSTGITACLLNAQAKIIAPMNVLSFDQLFWLACDYHLKDKLTQALEQLLITEDVKLIDRSEELKLISVHGPKAKEVTQKLVSSPLMGEEKGGGDHSKGVYPPSLPSPTRGEGIKDTPVKEDIPDQMLNHTKVLVNGVSLTCIRINLIGEIGYGLLIPKDHAGSIRDWLVQKGQPFGLRQIGAEALEILRIEAGIPRYGVDFDESNIPLEANLEKAVSFSKGCFPGQEILARLDSRGGVAKKLMGLELKGETVPKKNDRITKDGKEVGFVTSAAFSPTLKKIVALGYLTKECWTIGCEVAVETRVGGISARLTSLPFRM